MDVSSSSLWIVLLVLITIAVRLTKKESYSFSTSSDFKALQFQFFGAYFLALFGDWLQGPYVYALYKSYGFPESTIALLFLTGFASSSTFGTCTGPLSDKYGRKKMALLFCILYSLSCALKLTRNFWILFVGRILGGISTSLLFSVFETWYVQEHKDRQFDESWLNISFSTSTFGNGVIAILAGIVANFSASLLGPIGPFIISFLSFSLCFIFIALLWTENYGSSQDKILDLTFEALQFIFANQNIMLLGGVQSIVESSMYIFVFLWTPVLSSSSVFENESLPLGLIFSCFMVSLMIGSHLFSHLLTERQFNQREILRLVSGLLSCAHALVGISISFFSLSFLSFLCLETLFGLYFPTIGTLRSSLIPERIRCSVVNLFRIPLNLITIGSLLTLNDGSFGESKEIYFFFCSALLGVSCYLSHKLLVTPISVSSKTD